eukprot:4034557-Amphidinium_carterae.1
MQFCTLTPVFPQGELTSTPSTQGHPGTCMDMQVTLLSPQSPKESKGFDLEHFGVLILRLWVATKLKRLATLSARLAGEQWRKYRAPF